MRAILLSIIIIHLFISCSGTKSVQRVEGESSIIKLIEDSNLPSQLSKFLKGEIIMKYSRDSIIERSYEFIVPTEFNSYSSNVSRFPTIHSFEYSNKQVLYILYDKEDVLLVSSGGLSKEKFKETLKFSKTGIFFTQYLDTNDIDLLDGRFYGIIEDKGVTYFVVNCLLEGSKEALPIELLKKNITKD